MASNRTERTVFPPGARFLPNLQSGSLAAMRFSLIAVLLVFSGACASNPATGGPDFVLMSEEKEIELGRSMHPQVMAQYRAYPDAALQAYVNDIGQKLAANSDRPDLDYTFTVLDSDEVNAFATPGGFVYMSRGLLAYLNSEAELAAVLSHEIGHITARHAVRQGARSKVLDGLGGIASVVTGGASGFLSDYVGGALIKGYSRDLELEADREGAEYLVRTGYGSEPMVDVVRILKNQELFEYARAEEEGREPRVYHGLFSTHPDNDKRLREVIEAANKIDGGQATKEANRERFLQRVDGMTYGKVGAGGVISEGEFRHPKYGIGMRFPKGWSIGNNRGRIESVSPDRKSIIILTRQPLKEAVSPLTILTDRIGVRNLRDKKTLNVNNVQGYTALAPVANSPFGKRPVRYAVFTDEKYAYVVAGANSEDVIQKRDNFRIVSSMKSFRLLDARGLRSAEAPHIAVVEANGGTTMKRLASASPLTIYAEAQLRLLNDMYPTGEPEPGQKVKIID
ncbi:MAG: M48 family metalloprotease [Gammaproteobacteria bacterium]